MKKKNKISLDNFWGPSITRIEKKVISQMMNSGWSNYNNVEKFEKKFTKWHDRKFGLMTTSGTSAIHLALKSIKINKNDEIIVPDCTWTATAAPILYENAKPVFADIDKDNWCIDVKKVEALITKKTRAILFVDLYGNFPDIKNLKKIAKKYKLALIEDAAEALGSSYYNSRAGKLGLISIHSFQRTKTITSGEGGFILTDNKRIYDRIKLLRDLGRSKKDMYYANEIAPKYIPSNLNASMVLAQFSRINEILAKKKRIFLTYKKLLSSFKNLNLISDSKKIKNGCWANAVVFNKESKLKSKNIIKKMREKKIFCRPFFYPLTSQKAYSMYAKDYKIKNKNSYSIYQRGLLLPSSVNLSLKDIRFISNTFLKLITK